ncbi:MAG: amino acid permease [Ignavibacteriales bacterium]|nr:amino acid permease [Ignavibacteriales bacterium]
MTIKPKLNTFDTTMIVVSLVIGIGIFRTPAIVASSVNSTELFFAAWICGGIFSFIGALTFAEIGSRFTKPGAYYKVVAECYHPAAAFMLNWANVVIVNTAGTAAVAMIGAEYLTPTLFSSVTDLTFTTQLVAAGLTLFLLVINYLGIKTGAWTQNILTIFKIGMMLLIVAAAFYLGNQSSPVVQEIPASHSWWMGFALGLVSVYYTYGGYQNTLNFGGDVQSPKRNIPRAIFFGIAIIIILYLLINWAYIHLLGLEGVSGSKLVAAEVARVCFGNSASTVISITIFLSAMGFVNVTLMQIPRTYYAMAMDGALPKIFMRINSKTQAQEFTLIFFGGMVLLSIFLLGTFEKLVNYIMFFDNLNNAIVASTIFVLRKQSKITSETDSYKMPWFPVMPFLFILFLLGISINVFINQPTDTYIGIGILITGYPFYRLMKMVRSDKNS